MPSGAPDLKRRRAGVCLHLTSLPGPRGIGELGASARVFLDWMQSQDLSVWQFLPTAPTGYGDSPYQPLSVFAGNPLLIDLDTLADWGLLSRAEAQMPFAGPAQKVDFQEVGRSKRPVLALAAERFDAVRDSVLIQEFEAFCEANDDNWLNDYAAFILLKAHNSELAWPDWNDTDRPRRDASVGFAARQWPTDWRRIKLIQFFFARQWHALRAEANRRDILLFGDVPIYMALDCAEAWAHPELLALQPDFRPAEVAGVPPDYFSEDGQLWGNPVYCWERHAADGYGWWISRLRHALEMADLVRLDHFRGFCDYWAIPSGAGSAREGHWRAGPGGQLFDALAASLGGVPFVAEDLGIITDAVIDLRKAYALPGMRVLQFMVDQADFAAAGIEEDCVCYTGTHDNDTTEGWFTGSQGKLFGDTLESFQARVRSNVEGAEQSIHKPMIGLCFNTAARLAVAPLQDFLGLGSEARLNTPGQAHGNWGWRVERAALDSAGLDYIGVAVKETGRS